MWLATIRSFNNKLKMYEKLHANHKIPQKPYKYNIAERLVEYTKRNIYN